MLRPMARTGTEVAVRKFGAPIAIDDVRCVNRTHSRNRDAASTARPDAV